ncbi:MAG TPA: DNA gyrase subunit A [Bacteroidales bacterium]|nr:DNA gyrase subunit A [Bacteroidales bacterium]HOK74681.1 DNA gyrase subunit A [Bacteroidales bacterium]HOM39648.1 DNA gyrase subunit A [Bacteroidales bacterium]HPP91604.1 DNA gyrase subunit A [Bacteroidales bacterium]HQK69569.1 DNA gyrase subunit A [Bacteroidales bacterium]
MEVERVVKVNIEEEMKSAYIDYSMSVIVSRALPDVRDGLKPVQRRVLYGMWELGVLSNRPFKKSARIVGEVLGKYHPHGDTSVYEAMVRMAQDWSLRYPLIDGQGNFGSIDGDSPAAMRYTEARLKKIAEEMLADIDKNTVDFQLNFDDSLQEPAVLPSKIPNLLINGTSGIAVGMATNMPPHNLSEIVDAIVAFIENRNITVNELLQYVKGPDFPTGGIIYGQQGIKDAYETGRGKIIIRARTEIEHTHSGRECIVVTEIPFMVNKAEMIKKIADLINDGKLEGISYINDESDRNGTRVVIILKKDATANVVLNNLYKYSQLQTAFNVNNIALVKGRPRLLSLKDLIDLYVKHRHDVILRRTKFDLDQAEKRLHILEGLIIASDNIDEVVAIIRGSSNPDEAREKLIERFNLSEEQARAIVDMRLRQLTGLEQDKLRAEYEEVKKQIEYLRNVLGSIDLQMKIIKDELLEIKEKYGDDRRTEIVPNVEEFNPEDFYSDDEMVITISHLGYIKRTPLTEFRRQNRGGIGSRASTIRDEDFIEHLYIATMHNTMLFFTGKGKCYWLKVYNIPEGTRTSKGRAIQNLINIEPDDNIRAFINVKTLDDEKYIKNNYIVLCTAKGIIKKTSLEAYSRPRSSGVNAITVRDGDELIEARLTNGNHEIMLAVKSGRAIRFHESSVRPMGRTASGVRGIKLASDDDIVIGMITIENKEKDVLVVSEKGNGKRTSIDSYRITNRGGKGVKTINITEKTGSLIALKDVTDNDDLMIITLNGNILRIPVSGIRLMGRATQGVKLINLRENDSIASVACVEINEEDGGEEADYDDENFSPSNENGKDFDEF